MSLLIKEDSLLASEGQHFVQKQANKLCRLLQFSKERKKKKGRTERTEVWKVSFSLDFLKFGLPLGKS